MTVVSEPYLHKQLDAPIVLVVDDEPLNVDLLAQELEELGMQVLTAENGRRALEVLDDGGCDMMLLDIMMPEVDGFEVLQQLNADGRLASLPVIVISALNDIASVSRCIELGAEDHLLKPFDPTLLKARIQGTLEKKRLRDRVAQQLAVTRKVFGKYVPESVAEAILDGQGTVTPVQATATILYTDIAGFTGIVESMPPERAMQMLNEYFDAVIDPIRRHRGIVNQFQGDAMLVTFNVPMEDPRHADHAVQSAIEIQAALVERDFAGVRLHTRIGINTGPVVAGNVGSGDRLNYTVHGDTVNVAARLEELNKQHGTDTLVSGATVQALRYEYPIELLGNFCIRGKSEEVQVYSIAAE